MKLKKRKLRWKKILLISGLSFTGCASMPEVTPHVVDTQLMRCREYTVIDKENLTIKFKKSWPIEHCNGFYAIPQEEAALLKNYFLQMKSN